MKKTLLFLAFLLGIAVQYRAYSFSAVAPSGQTLYYKIVDGNAHVTNRLDSYLSPYYTTYPTGDLIIPSTVTYNGTTYSVTSIRYYAFANCSELTSVTIPTSVTSIGDYAFRDCTGLTSITIPNSVTFIGNGTFSCCSGLTSITIPDSVTSIGYSAFYNCTGLTSVTIGSSVTSIGYDVFRLCSSLTSITIPYTVTSIGKWAFKDCVGLTTVNFNATDCTTMGTADEPAFSGCTSLATVNIGENVKRIPDYAFKGCSGLTGTLTIPDSITHIGKLAFSGCTGVSTVNFNATNCSTMGTADSLVFSGCISLATVNFGENVRRIPSYAFKDFSGLTGTLTLPDSLRSIGLAAFNGCSGLTGTLTLPDSVRSIGSYAFYGCSGLTGTITIPDSATSINSQAFYGCTGLTSVTIGKSITSIGSGAFQSCTGLTTVNYNATNCTTMGTANNPVFSNCTSMATLNIGENVQTIPAYALKNCTGLTTVNYNATNCTSMGTSNLLVFSDCTSLATLNIGENVQSIPNKAFQNWTGLTTVNFNATNCTTMGSSSNLVFSGCTSLATVNIGDNVQRIPNCAFYSCTGLTSVTIGNSVTYIGSRAFAYCTSLTTVNFNATHCTTMGSVYNPVFLDCTSSATINIGDNVQRIPAFAFMDFSGVTGMLNIPNSVTWIGCCAFYNCAGLTSITIGNSVSSIDSSAFKNCSNITEIHSLNSVAPTLYNSIYTGYIFRSFSGVPSNIPVYIPCGSLQSYQDKWGSYRYSSFTNFIEEMGATFSAVSDNETMGTVNIDTYPDCTNSLATVSATANAGYIFSHWSDGSTDNPHSILVASDTTVVAYFVPAATVTVTSDNTTMGAGIGSGIYAIGGTATISAEANYGYHFTQWNDGNTDNPRTINIAGDTSFTAFFEINHYTVNVVSDNTDLGSATGGGTFDYSTSITISAAAVADHHFTHWQDGNTQNPRTITVTADTTYTAYFAIDEYTLTVVPNYTSRGTVTGGGTYAVGTTVTISANANNGYHFTQWNDGITDNPRTVTVTGNATYTTYFEPNQYTVTVVSDNTEMGIVTGGGTFDYGTSISITAIAVAGHNFTHWNDGNTQNPRTLTVTGDATYTAYFETTLYTITVLSDDPTLGTVTGGGTYPEGSIITISAQPAGENCHFSQWQDGNRDNPRTITVTGNAEYVAHFLYAEGIDDVEATDNIKIYSRGNTIVIDFSRQQAAYSRQSVIVYDVMGRVIKQTAGSGQQAAVEIPVTSAGVYMVKVGDQPSCKVAVRP